MISSFIFIAKEAYFNLQRNLLMTVATISTFLISTLILGIFLLTTMNLSSWTQKVINQLQIVVYLKDDFSSDGIATLQKEVQTMSEVREVEFISKEKALARVKASLDGKVDLKHLPRNPLPNSFEIKLKNMHKVKEVADKLSKLPGIEKIKYGKYLAESLLALHTLVSIFGFLLVFLSLLSTFFIILNTIRLTILAREKEIKLMTLVGATPWLVRWPFILEGVIQGLVGTLPALLLISIAYKFLIPNIANTLSFIPFLAPQQVSGPLTLTLLLTGIGVGAVGAYISVNKHLTYE